MNDYLVNYKREDGIVDVLVFKNMWDIYNVLEYAPKVNVKTENIISIIKLNEELEK